jgi:hypothetical protein
LCGGKEGQPEIFSAVTTPVKLGMLGKFDIRRQNKRTVYIGYKFFRHISEQGEYFSGINVQNTREITAKVCDVRRITVKKLCSETSNSPSDNQVFASSRKAHKRKHDVTDMNVLNNGGLCRRVYEFYDKEEHQSTGVKKV